MGTRLFGDIKAGTTSTSLAALLLKTADNTPDTGLVAASLSAYYYRQGASSTTSVTLSDLSTLNSAFSAGGVKEIGDGKYRVDWPDAAFATGADWVTLTVKDGSTSLYNEEIRIESQGAADVAAVLPSAAVNTSGGLPTIGTGAGQIEPDGSGHLTLSAAGVDTVTIETGLNLRQAISLIASALNGVLAGAGTGTITIKGAGVGTTRITASTDGNGNRTSVTLSPPA